MRLTFLGANRQVTGSRTLVELAGRRLLVDCGMFQERAHLARNWAEPPLDPTTVDAVILTHGHLDHVGLVPRWVQQGYRGRIVATEPTVDLAGIVMEDSAEIQEEDAAYKKRRHRREGRRGPHPELPLYTLKDARAAIGQLEGVPYGAPVDLGGGVSVTFHEAGHILGSAVVEIVAMEDGHERRLVFSGDLGQWDKPLIGDPTLLERADVVVMESTYGDRNHEERERPAEALAQVVEATVAAGGSLVIPTFAIERAQELVYHLGRLVRTHRIPELPMFLDSPMAIDVTSIFRRHRDYLDDETRALFESGEPPLRFPGLRMTRSVEESKAINGVPAPKVILASSGMCTGGRIKHHLRRHLGDRDSTVLFVGYQADGTLGRQILEGRSPVRIHGQTFAVRARIVHLNGFSAHGDRDDLLRWMAGFHHGPRDVFLVHGEEKSAESLASALREQSDRRVQVPAYGEVVEL